MGLVFMEFGNLGSYKFGIHAKAVKTNIYILARSFVFTFSSNKFMNFTLLQYYINI